MIPPSLLSSNFKVISSSSPAASMGEEEMESPLGVDGITVGVEFSRRCLGWVCW